MPRSRYNIHGQHGILARAAPARKERATIAPQPITIRPLPIAHIHARADELRAIYRAAFAAPPYHEDEQGAAIIFQALLDHTHKPGFRCFGAEPTGGGPLLGVVYGYQGVQDDWWRERVAAALPPATADLWLGDCFEYAGFAVAPSAQRQGVGARLHDALLAGLPQRAAVLSTIQAESPALAFYRAHGWITLREQYAFAPAGPPWRLMGLPCRCPPRGQWSRPPARPLSFRAPSPPPIKPPPANSSWTAWASTSAS
ncbi:MAG TPA: GNAT family N-acetyltransferase [Ktedonobacterales bacterium]